jgi:hypothetical protein
LIQPEVRKFVAAEAKSCAEIKGECGCGRRCADAAANLEGSATQMAGLPPGACSVPDDLVEGGVAQAIANCRTELLGHRFPGHLDPLG